MKKECKNKRRKIEEIEKRAVEQEDKDKEDEYRLQEQEKKERRNALDISFFPRAIVTNFCYWLMKARKGQNYLRPMTSRRSLTSHSPQAGTQHFVLNIPK